MPNLDTCHGCGVVKDLEVLEAYPWPDEDMLCAYPVEPLFPLDCSDWYGSWRRCTVCHSCFHRLSPDLWIDRKGWESISPTTAFTDLPLLVEKK